MLGSWRWWVTLAGAVFQLVGLGIAVSGLGALSREVFGRPLPLGRAWRRGRARARRWLGHKRGAVTVTLGEAIEVSEAASIKRIVQSPADDASLTEWVTFLRHRVDEADAMLEQECARATVAERDLHKRIDAESSTRASEIGRAEALARQAVGGEDGSGLDRAWWGLATTALGVGVSAIAVLWPS